MLKSAKSRFEAFKVVSGSDAVAGTETSSKCRDTVPDAGYHRIFCTARVFVLPFPGRFKVCVKLAT